MAVLLGSYHAFVRYTMIGEVLNGGVIATPARSGCRAAATGRRATPTLSSVSKRYGQITALDGLGLEVIQGNAGRAWTERRGQVDAIGLMLGLNEPDAGTATLCGVPPAQVEARYQVGVMMRRPLLLPSAGAEHIDLVCHYYPSPMTADEAMALTHITALAERPAGKLSGGQKRQVQFAIAIVGLPALRFDEPTVGLDVQARELMWATLRKLVAAGASIVLTTHYIEEAEALADRVAVVANGH